MVFHRCFYFGLIARLALLLGDAVALYGLVLTLAAKPVLHLLYAGKYDEHWLLVGLFGASSAASVATGIFVSLLKARGDTRVVSGIWAMSAVLIAVFSVPLVYLAGVEGAAIAATLSYVAACFVAYAFSQT